MSRTVSRRVAVVGGTLGVVVLLGVGLAFAAAPGPDNTSTGTRVSASSEQPSVATPAVPADPEPTSTTVVAAPVPTSTPATSAPKSTAAPTTTKPAPATAAAPAAKAPATPATTVAPAAPKLAPGQRLNPTSAQVQAAITQLHQRIPLFQPTESQLRTFADAVCASFDQGQTAAQVQSTVQQAVSHVQGASLSAADAQFAVTLMAQLRCPGYLP